MTGQEVGTRLPRVLERRRARGRGGDPANSALPGLGDLGIEPMRSSRWQALARMAELSAELDRIDAAAARPLAER